MKTGQILQFPLLRGLDEDGNPKSHPVSALKAGNNIRWPRSGVIGKRYGTRRLEGLGAVTRFVTRGEELGAINAGSLQTHDPLASDGAGRLGPPVSGVELDWPFTLVDDEAGVACTDAAVSGGLLIQAWVTGDPTMSLEATPVPTGARNAYVQVVNQTTGQPIMPPTLLAGDVEQVRVLISDDFAFILYSTGPNIRLAPVSLLSFAFDPGDVQDLATDRVEVADNNFSGRFDALIRANGNLVLVYERDTSSSSKLAAVRWTVLGLALVQAADEEHADTTWVNAIAVSIAEDTAGGQIFILYSRNNTVRLRSVDRDDMTALAAVSSIETTYYASHVTVYAQAENSALCAWSGYAITGGVRLPSLRSSYCACSLGGVSVAASRTRRSMAMALLSRLFKVDGAFYAFAVDGRDAEDDGNINSRKTFPSTYLVQIPFGDYSSITSGVPPHVLVAKIDHDIGATFQGGSLPSAPVLSGANTAYGLLPYQADAAQEAWDWRTGLRLVRATVDLTLIADPFRSVTIGQETYVKGGFLGAWDGRSFFDYGMRAPVLILLQESAANGHMANGTYLYQFEPGFRSRAGVLHRGPLSDVITAIHDGTGPSGKVSIRLCSHGIDGKQVDSTGYANAAGSGAFLNAFRTEANGSALHQLTMPPRYNVFPNDPTASTVDFLDTADDSDIGLFGSESPNPGTIPLATRPQPYTASGEIEDCQPPAQYTILLHGGRIFLVLGDRRTIWFSKDYRENPNIAPGFNPAQVELYEQPITALASMDSYRIVLWERGLWYVTGDGPTVSDTENRFSAPILIQSEVGCTNPRSVVSTPFGVIFQSGTDLYALRRNLVVEMISQSAQETLASFPNITSAVLVAKQSEVRFTCNDAQNTNGIVLVFDYARGTWFTRTYPGGGAITDAVLHEGVYYLAVTDFPVSPEERVLYEDTLIHYDADAFTAGGEGDPAEDVYVVSTVELEHIGPAGPVGWQRVRLVKPIGQSLGNHALSVALARDYSTTYEQTEDFPAGSDVTTPGTHLRCEVAPTVQRRQAVGIKLTDAAPANTTAYPIGNGAGFQLEGIALLVQPKPGFPRDTSSRRGG